MGQLKQAAAASPAGWFDSTMSLPSTGRLVARWSFLTPSIRRWFESPSPHHEPLYPDHPPGAGGLLKDVLISDPAWMEAGPSKGSINMSHEEARRLVQIGLDQRKEERQKAEREQRLEAYERDMITHCNGNAVAAKTLRLMTECDRITREQISARRKAEREQMMREWERDAAVYDSIRRYLVGCLVLMLVTVWTPLPWWAAAAVIGGTAVWESAHVFRLYNPITGGEEEC